MSTKKQWVIHPYLFTAFPILFLFSINMGEVSPSEALLPLAVGLVCAFLLMVLLKLALSDSNKAGIITSIIMVLFFSYGHVYNLGLTWHVGPFYIGRHRALMLVWFMIFALGSYFAAKRRRDLRSITSVLNVIAFSLVATSLLNIGICAFNERGIKSEVRISMQDKKRSATSADATSVPRRDIYYIILDGYASSDVLKEFYGYDNHEFLEYLRRKGFYIVSNGRSNYAMSALSMASSLNMEYLDRVVDAVGATSKSLKIPIQMVKKNNAANFLKSKGYKFVYFGWSWETNSDADLNLRFSGINEFHVALLQTTMLSPFERRLLVGALRKKALFIFSKLAELPKIEGPKFVFAHIILPHPPFMFGREGEPVSTNILKMGGTVWTQKKQYLDQLVFTNNKVKVLVDEILAQSKIPPVIIFQGDHGPCAMLSDGIFDGWHNPSEDMLKERMGILNAYYLPQGGDALLYDAITPVNTFRLIFNIYFSASYEMLKDQNYFSNYDQPYAFTNVTDKIRD